MNTEIPTRYEGQKIDAHAHIGKFGSWAGVESTAEQLVRQMQLYNVTKSVLFYLDNELVREAVANYPQQFVGYVWPNPNDGKNAVSLVRKALGSWNFKGIKLHPLVHSFLPNDEMVYPIMQEARSFKVPVAIHSGHAPFSLPWSIGEVAENFRDVTIVMLHMGHGHGVYIQAAINTAKRYDNILLETSGMPMHTKIAEAMKILGDNRVMYGSDTPFHEPAVEIDKICSAGLSRNQLEKIFYQNALETLGL
jgi:predicted TIM-barrel fold metal-dependent hydrolase